MTIPTEHCGARLPSGITCDREIGHPGPPRGYLADHDEPIFWYDDPAYDDDNPPGASGFPVKARGPSSAS
jgi:hypothetical protein